jgi:hypothetical protein
MDRSATLPPGRPRFVGSTLSRYCAAKDCEKLMVEQHRILYKNVHGKDVAGDLCHEPPPMDYPRSVAPSR